LTAPSSGITAQAESPDLGVKRTILTNDFPLRGFVPMIDDFHMSASPDSSYVALQGQVSRTTVNVRVNSIAIDDLDELTRAPTQEQRRAFAHHNLDALNRIAAAKIERGDAEHESWFGRDALAVRITGDDFT
jgi:hypothetical protein